jgi:aminocarboxymuconate-semialdehyde decarboxylase
VDLAISELRHVAELGLAGVEIGSNVNGAPIGAAQFDPFFQAADELGMAVFVHALRPCGMDRLVGPPALEQALAFPGEVGLAAASVITSNLMLRRRGLKLAFSHGGGSLPMLLPRLQHAWERFPALQETLCEAPLKQARRLYYDTLVYDAATVRHLAAVYGADRLMLGTDYPFAIQESDPVGRLREAGFGAADTQAMLRGTAAAFIGLGA